MAEGGISSSKWYDKILPFLTKAENQAKQLEIFTYKFTVFQTHFKACIEEIQRGETTYMEQMEGTIKESLEFLQYYCHFNYGVTKFSMPVLGKEIIFRLTESTKLVRNLHTRVPAYQILISFWNNAGSSWEFSRYSDILPKFEGLSMVNQKKLAQVILDSLKCATPLHTNLPREVEDVMEHDARLVLITHICESAVPLYDDLRVYREIVVKYKDQDKDKVPNINDKPAFQKTGRIPLADKITRAKLRKIAAGKSTFLIEFDGNNFPIVKPKGTSLGRHWALQGRCLEDLSDDEEISDGEKIINNGLIDDTDLLAQYFSSLKV